MPERSRTMRLSPLGVLAALAAACRPTPEPAKAETECTGIAADGKVILFENSRGQCDAEKPRSRTEKRNVTLFASFATS